MCLTFLRLILIEIRTRKEKEFRLYGRRVNRDYIKVGILIGTTTEGKDSSAFHETCDASVAFSNV